MTTAKQAGLFDPLLEKAREKRPRIVLPEADQVKMVTAGVRAFKDGVATPILLGNPEQIKKAAQEGGERIPESLPIIDLAELPEIERYAEQYVRIRGGSISPRVAARLVKRPLFYSGMLVATGEADGMIAGFTCPTARVCEAAGLTIGLKEGTETPSSFFIMAMPDGRTCFFADCALNIAPDPEQLADIAVSTGRSARALFGWTPIIAMLSFSTRGSASHELVDHVVEATKAAVRKADPDMVIDGEMQADTALVESVAAKKAPDSAVAGRANILIFPGLNSANIAYKLVQRLAGAGAYGPFLQGYAKPVCDLSRGATVDDIFMAIAVTAAQV